MAKLLDKGEKSNEDKINTGWTQACTWITTNYSITTTNTVSKLCLFMPQKSCNCAPGTHNTVWRNEEN
jgi:hypothetical protein